MVHKKLKGEFKLHAYELLENYWWLQFLIFKKNLLNLSFFWTFIFCLWNFIPSVVGMAMKIHLCFVLNLGAENMFLALTDWNEACLASCMIELKVIYLSRCTSVSSIGRIIHPHYKSLISTFSFALTMFQYVYKAGERLQEDLRSIWKHSLKMLGFFCSFWIIFVLAFVFIMFYFVNCLK